MQDWWCLQKGIYQVATQFQECHNNQVPNHWRIGCLFKLKVNKTSKLRITDPLWGESVPITKVQWCGALMFYWRLVWISSIAAKTSIGNPIVEIRWSYDRLISTMWFSILVRLHLYIESGPCKCNRECASRKSYRQIVKKLLKLFFFISTDTLLCSHGAKHYDTKIIIVLVTLHHRFVIVMQNSSDA